ncbi:MAG: hypothetical protein JRJ29_12215 [Deltaproteobacteria bacterium]|nr:hypothetical protein [Deltaproteobacteria bacterium]
MKSSLSGTASAQVEHVTPMLNPEIVYSVDGVREFDRRIKALGGIEGSVEYAVEPRIGGLCVELVYVNTRLSVASTRGDGYRGREITDNIKTILSVPLGLERIHGDLPFPGLLVIWGVVYMETKALLSLNRERSRSGLSPFLDSKQAAQDSLEQKDPKITAKRPLEMFCCGVARIEGFTFKTYSEMMQGLQSWGLRVNRPHIKVFSHVDDLVAHCRREVGGETELFPFDTDGLVIKVNSLDLQSRLHVKSRNIPWALEFRFSSH